MKAVSHSSRSVLSYCRRPAVGWLQLFIILFWIISPALRLNAVYVPDSTGLNPSYWLPLSPGDNQPANGPDTGDADGNGVADWYDQFQAAVNNSGLVWWSGGSDHNGTPFIIDGTAVSFPAQWSVPLDSDGDGIPDSADPYPNDPTNNSYWWAGDRTLQFQGRNYLVRAQWFAGSDVDMNGDGVPDCMEAFLANLNSATSYYWPGGTFLLDGQYSTFGEWYLYGYDTGDADGDGIPDAIDPYPNDPWNNTYTYWAGGDWYINGVLTHFDGHWYGGLAIPDTDGDGIPDDLDPYPTDFNNNSAWWPGGTFMVDGQWQSYGGSYHAANAGDADMDGIPDDLDGYPNDVYNNSDWWPGGDYAINGVLVSFPGQWHLRGETDADGDGLPDSIDPLASDATNNSFWWNGGTFTVNNNTVYFPGSYYLGAWADADNDGIPDSLDPYVSDTINGNSFYWQGGTFAVDNAWQTWAAGYYPGIWADTDNDGIPDPLDPYPNSSTNNSSTFWWPGGVFYVNGAWQSLPSQVVIGLLDAGGNFPDADGDGIPDSIDPYPNDFFNNGPGYFFPPLDSTGAPTTVTYAVDMDNHLVTFSSTVYYAPWADTDGDGIPDDLDPYPYDYYNARDTDSDGIPDSVEVAYGLNPNDPSDVDYLRYVNGQSDGITWKQAYDRGCLDQLQDNTTDSDGDGMSDLYEIVNGLNPYNAADAVDSRIGYLMPGDAVTMNDFILNVEKARWKVPLSHVVTDPYEYYQITGQWWYGPPAHDFSRSVAENDWDGDGVSNRDEVFLFMTDLRGADSRPADADLIAAYLSGQTSITTNLNFSTAFAWWAGGTFMVDGTWQPFSSGYHPTNPGDSDGDGIPNDIDPYVSDPNNNSVWWEGRDVMVNGTLVYMAGQWRVAGEMDSDGDGIPDSIDPYPYDPNNNSYWWSGGSDRNGNPFVVDGVAVSFPAQWSIAMDSDGDGIPDSADPYPNDATNNSYWWAGDRTLQFQGRNYLVRAQWFAGSDVDMNGDGVPDCMESFLANLNSATSYYWPGGTFLLDGQYSTFGEWYLYGYDTGDADGDGIPDAIDPYPNDPWNNTYTYWAGGDWYINGVLTHFDGHWYGGLASPDSDGDGIPDDLDPYPTDFNNNSAWWPGGTFMVDGQWQSYGGCYHAASAGDADMDGIPDDLDPHPNDQYNNSDWWPGGDYSINGSVTSLPGQWHLRGEPDSDNDGIPDSLDPYPSDNSNNSFMWGGGSFTVNNSTVYFPGGYYMGIWADSDGDGIPDSLDPYVNDTINGNSFYWSGGTFAVDNAWQTWGAGYYPGIWADADSDGIPDSLDLYANSSTNNSATFWWAGGTFWVDGLWQTFPAQVCIGQVDGNGNFPDADGDLIPDSIDPYPNDFFNNGPGYFFPPLDANRMPTTVSYTVGGDNHTISFTSAVYYAPWADADMDGIPDDLDPYPNDSYNAVDTDGDGIPDSVEVAYGLNRNDPSDADHFRYVNGETDGVSWKQAYDRGWLDALQDHSVDSDGDGMSDLYEIVNGLSPSNASDAVDARIGYLMPGDAVTMNDFILNVEKYRFGISLSHVVTDPNEYYQITGHWWNGPPTHDYSRSVAENDWDGDGVSNVDEVKVFQTDLRGGQSHPSDADLVAAYIQTRTSTTTNLNFANLFATIYSDSDGDGYTNGEEIIAGTDPFDPNSHPNPPPPTLTAIGDSKTSINGASADIQVGASGGAEPYTYAVTAGPSHGVLDDMGFGSSGTASYTPDSGFTGTDSFGFSVTDASGITASGTVTITCTIPPPVLHANPVNAASNNGAVANIQAGATGGSGSYTYSLNSRPDHGILDETSFATTGALTYTPKNDGFTGQETFSYSVYDGYDSDGADIVVTVTRDANLLTATPQTVTVTSGQAVVITLGATGGTKPYSFAPDNIDLTLGTIGNISQDGTNLVLTYSANPDMSGVDTLHFTVTDSNGGTSTADVTINVDQGQQNPVIETIGDYQVMDDRHNEVALTVGADMDPHADLEQYQIKFKVLDYKVKYGVFKIDGNAVIKGKTYLANAAVPNSQQLTMLDVMYVPRPKAKMDGGDEFFTFQVIAVKITDPMKQVVSQNDEEGHVYPPHDPECPTADIGAHGIVCHAMADYEFDFFRGAFSINDYPLTYQAAFGPNPGIRFHYNSGDSSDTTPGNPGGSASTTHLGPRWKLNWIQYIETQPADPDQVWLNMGRGGEIAFKRLPGTTKFGRPGISYDTIEETPSGSGTWIHTHPDSTREVYSTVGGNGPDGQHYIFLSSVSDPFGNTVNLTWQAAGGGMRLAAIQDATLHSTTFQYEDATHPLRVTKVTDPFGRFCTVQYTPAGDVWKLTDPVGIVSEFAYQPGGDSLITSLTTPYGTTTFESTVITSSAGRPNGRRVVVTDPLGKFERIDRMTFADTIPANEPIPGVIDATRLSLHNTYHWAKAATGPGGGLDADNARIIRWAEDSGGGGPMPVPASTKMPLMNRVWLTYPGLAWGLAGTSAIPSQTTQVQADGNTEFTTVTSANDLGLIVAQQDPQGRVTNYEYPVGSRDLFRVWHSAGGQTDLLSTFTNYLHGQPRQMTAANGSTTNITYNARGQVVTVTNANNETTSITYNEAANSPAFGREATVTAASGTALAATSTYGYDAYGRLVSVSDSSGDTATMGYDVFGNDPLKTLDRVSITTGPDGSGTYVMWDKLDVGEEHEFHPGPNPNGPAVERVTTYTHDANRKLIRVHYPSGKEVNYIQGNCCGSVDTLVDAAGNQTHWVYDVLGRETQKWLRWNQPDQVLVQEHFYDAVGRTDWQHDARGNEKHYAYDAEGRLGAINYVVNAGNTQATPDVSFTYEPVYGRMATVSDVTGATLSYAYNPVATIPGAGMLASETKFLPDGTVQYTNSYAYDVLGRRKAGPRVSDAHWDALGRLHDAASSLGTFTFGYQGTSGRVQQVDTVLTGAAVASRVSLTYETPNPAQGKSRRLTGILNQLGSGGAWSVLSQHSYGYDGLGRLATWQNTWKMSTTTPWSTASNWAMTHDADDQLTKVTESSFGMSTGAYDYTYDLAGNRMQAKRTKNATIILPGTPASTQVTSTWTANGYNQLEAQTAPAANATTYTYDADGNLLDDGARTYEWDAENRLVAVNYGGGRRVEWTYDAFSRRVKQEDITATGVRSIRDLIWEGLSLIESRATQSGIAGEVRKYYGNGEERVAPGGGITRLSYTKDHLGSIRELVDTGGTVRAHYDYDPFGNRTKATGTSLNLDSDFGYTGHYTHEASGLVLAPYRGYDPATGKWLSRDPIGEEGGINLYGYVGNRPTTLIDPLGLEDGAIRLVKETFNNIFGFLDGTGRALGGAADALGDGFMDALVTAGGLAGRLGDEYDKAFTAVVGAPPEAVPCVGGVGKGIRAAGAAAKLLAAAVKAGKVAATVEKADRVILPIAKRLRFTTRKEAREAAERASPIGKAIAEKSEHGCHYHPLDAKGNQTHDHYYFPDRFW